MRQSGHIGQLEQLMAEHGDRLMQTSVLLAGNQQDAEDLLQSALERLLRRSRHVDDPLAYVRRVLWNLAADGWRRRGTIHRKLPLLDVRPASPSPAETVDLRDALTRILRTLPPRQRAVIVLRYWEDLSSAETAAALGCSEGTVRTTATRGLRRMRELAGPWLATEIGR